MATPAINIAFFSSIALSSENLCYLRKVVLHRNGLSYLLTSTFTRSNCPEALTPQPFMEYYKIELLNMLCYLSEPIQPKDIQRTTIPHHYAIFVFSITVVITL
jgi:hypothetical protein